jgi:hypothetical protein
VASARAETKAKRLMRLRLTDAQDACLSKHKFIPVIGNRTGRTYRIYEPYSYIQGGHHICDNNVFWYNGAKRMASYNCRPKGDRLPTGDVMLAQKLVLENCEDKFLERACLVDFRHSSVGVFRAAGSHRLKATRGWFVDNAWEFFLCTLWGIGVGLMFFAYFFTVRGLWRFFSQ